MGDDTLENVIRSVNRRVFKMCVLSLQFAILANPRCPHPAGSLTSQFSEFAILPSHSFAIVILSAGKKNNAIELHHLALDYFLPAFDKALIEATEEQLGGIWLSSDGQVEMHVQVQDTALIVSKFIIGKIDALKTLNRGVETNKAQLWDVGNNHFR